MARTGISIQVTNTVLGSPPQVNANSMLFVANAKATTGSSQPFTLDTPFMLQSTDDLETLGITAENNPDVYEQVTDFYAPTTGVNNSGTILWLVGVADNASLTGTTLAYVQATVRNGFQYRPRNIAFSPDLKVNGPTQQELQTEIDELYMNGFSVVALTGGNLMGAIAGAASTMPDLSTMKSGMVGTVIVAKKQKTRPCVGAVLGWMSQLSVGTSIGDGTLPPFSDSMYFTDGTVASGTITWVNTPVAAVTLNTLNTLGDKQYIFARTRPPRNGLWFNDGATAEDPTTALSTLENARTIAAMVDDLRSFFTPYLNSKVPAASNGDINPTYKQAVLDNARQTVIIPYIDNGDISDARITLRALNDDLTGTRTWEVTLEILDAVTLRWVEGYVFYVKNLA